MLGQATHSRRTNTSAIARRSRHLSAGDKICHGGLVNGILVHNPVKCCALQA